MKTLQERFWEKVKKGNPSECWEWTASRSNKRYGNIKVNGKMIKAHRLSYVLHFGEINPNDCVLHRCDNGLCVNPNHLFIGFQIDNIEDCKNKGRIAKQQGEQNGNSKLKVCDVYNIRAAYQACQKYGILSQLARRYNVTPQTIFGIVNNKTWNLRPPAPKKGGLRWKIHG